MDADLESPKPNPEIEDDEEVPEEKPEGEPEDEGEPDDVEDKDPSNPEHLEKTINKAMKKMKKEDEEWWSSVHNMSIVEPQNKFWDGFSKLEEDALIRPYDANAEFVNQSQEPKPGEPGFAPQGRVGGLN
jgi:hypothetical protein